MSASAVRWPLPPAFEPVREVGGGGASIVCEAVQRSTGRAVAVKVVTLPFDDPAASRRFARECATMAVLAAHPNVVTLIDAGVHEDRPWIAMELCRRGSFAAPRVPGDRIATMADIARTARDIRAGLGHDRSSAPRFGPAPARRTRFTRRAVLARVALLGAAWPSPSAARPWPSGRLRRPGRSRRPSARPAVDHHDGGGRHPDPGA